MPKGKNTKQTPLTLEVLADYSREILFPAMDERFSNKKEFNEFKNDSLGNQDEILKKLDILLTEKTARLNSEEREKKLWALIIKALKQHNILSPKEMTEISRLKIFD